MPENQSKPATVQSAQSEERPQILVITGISGAGRSTVANVLEDEGWYVIDNIPPQMLGSLAELVTRDGARVPKVALGIDVRARALFSDLPAAIETLRKSDIDFSMLFLDAKDETLLLATRLSAARTRCRVRAASSTVFALNALSLKACASLLTAPLTPPA